MSQVGIKAETQLKSKKKQNYPCLPLSEYCRVASCWPCWFQSVASWRAAWIPHGQRVSVMEELTSFLHLSTRQYKESSSAIPHRGPGSSEPFGQ